jgi:hypothetical protein
MPVKPSKNMKNKSNSVVKNTLCQCHSESNKKYQSTIKEEQFGKKDKKPKKPKFDIKKAFIMGS